MLTFNNRTQNKELTDQKHKDIRNNLTWVELHSAVQGNSTPPSSCTNRADRQGILQEDYYDWSCLPTWSVIQSRSLFHPTTHKKTSTQLRLSNDPNKDHMNCSSSVELEIGHHGHYSVTIPHKVLHYSTKDFGGGEINTQTQLISLSGATH